MTSHRTLAKILVVLFLCLMAYGVGWSRGAEWTHEQTCLLLADFFELYTKTDTRALGPEDRALLKNIERRMQVMERMAKRHAVAP